MQCRATTITTRVYAGDLELARVERSEARKSRLEQFALARH